MKFFIDTANLEEIKQAAALGILDGVTTNPSLVAKTGKPFAAVAKEICALVDGPVSLEVVGLKASEMLEEARTLRKYGKNVVVKIPMTEEGLIAVRQLSNEKIPTNVTLIFQPIQALLAAKAGATYVSPFIGRLDDLSQNGLVMLGEILQVFKNYGLKTEVLAASIRHPIHVIEAAKLGTHVVTLPLKVIQQLMKHPLTESGLQTFLNDWKSVPRS